ncbi:unnamed protein product [Cyprideis torosa]|uniref:Uncharacterized protein n=1 Tax=Cyprideis torosa TaxID=163714 RepID=A0A7R8ZNZ4_9CRUS|nr:unnamed protein product [Cyprideis torosa]CAG0897560.1 unnamed protein product [Cyprideis torosa]
MMADTVSESAGGTLNYIKGIVQHPDTGAWFTLSLCLFLIYSIWSTLLGFRENEQETTLQAVKRVFQGEWREMKVYLYKVRERVNNFLFTKSVYPELLRDEYDSDEPTITEEEILKGIHDKLPPPLSKEEIKINATDTWNNRKKNRCKEGWRLSKYPRGLCIIINVRDFEFEANQKEKEWERKGSEVDVENLTQLFTHSYFQVRSHINPTKKDMMKIIETYAKYQDHGQTMMLIVLTHGLKFLTDDILFPSDFQPDRQGEVYRKGIPTSWILQQFSDKNCPSLAGKPKVFIFQDCRPPTYNRKIFKGKVPNLWKRLSDPSLVGKDSHNPRHCAILRSRCKANVDNKTERGSVLARAIFRIITEASERSDLYRHFAYIAKQIQWLKTNHLPYGPFDPEVVVPGPFLEYFFNNGMIESEEENAEAEKQKKRQ